MADQTYLASSTNDNDDATALSSTRYPLARNDGNKRTQHTSKLEGSKPLFTRRKIMTASASIAIAPQTISFAKALDVGGQDTELQLLWQEWLRRMATHTRAHVQYERFEECALKETSPAWELEGVISYYGQDCRSPERLLGEFCKYEDGERVPFSVPLSGSRFEAQDEALRLVSESNEKFKQTKDAAEKKYRVAELEHEYHKLREETEQIEKQIQEATAFTLEGVAIKWAVAMHYYRYGGGLAEEFGSSHQAFCEVTRLDYRSEASRVEDDALQEAEAMLLV